MKWLFDVGTIWQEPHERGGSVSLCLFLFRLHDIHNIDFMCFSGFGMDFEMISEVSREHVIILCGGIVCFMWRDSMFYVKCK